MATINSYRDLLVWKKAMDLAARTYEITGRFPKHEQFGLTFQMRKSAVSVPSNIAEGFCRRTLGAYIGHLSIALGSDGELDTQAELAERLGFATHEDAVEIRARAAEVGRMLSGLAASLIARRDGREQRDTVLPST